MASPPADQNLPSQAAALRSHPSAPSLTAALSPHLRMCQDKIPLSPFQVNPSLCNPRLLLPGNAPHSIAMGTGYRCVEMMTTASPPQPGTMVHPHHRVLMTDQPHLVPSVYHTHTVISLCHPVKSAGEHRSGTHSPAEGKKLVEKGAVIWGGRRYN